MQVAALEVQDKFVVLVNFMSFNSDKASFVFKIHTSVFFLTGDVTASNDVTRDSGEDACLKIIVCELALK